MNFFVAAPISFEPGLISAGFIYGTLLFIGLPGPGDGLALDSLMSFLMLVAAVRWRLSNGTSRGWFYAYGVFVSISLVGMLFWLFGDQLNPVLQGYPVDKVWSTISQNWNVLAAWLIGMALPFMVLRIGLQQVRGSAVPNAAIRARTDKVWGKLTAIIVAPAFAMYLVVLIVELITGSGYRTYPSAPPPLSAYQTTVLQGEHTYFFVHLLFLAAVIGFIATRTEGHERPDLYPVAKLLWWSVFIVFITTLALQLEGIFMDTGSSHWHTTHNLVASLAADVAVVSSLTLLAVTPGISPLRKFASGGFRRRTESQKGH